MDIISQIITNCGSSKEYQRNSYNISVLAIFNLCCPSPYK